MNDEVGLIVARVLLYGGALTVLGLPAYFAYAPAATREWLAARRWPWRGVALAAMVAILASVAHLLLLTAAMNGVTISDIDADMLRFVATEMPVGRAALVRLIALALLLGLALRRGRLRTFGCIVAGMVAVVSLSWNGHAMMHEGVKGWLHALLDQAHLVAAAIWFGALIALLGLAGAEGADGRVARREAFGAFSFVGTVVVATLILTGLLNTALIVGVPGGGDPAWNYIAVLSLKIAAFVAALGLAAHNRFTLAPALAAPLADAELGARVRRSVAVELGLILSVVAVVAVLGILSPSA